MNFSDDDGFDIRVDKILGYLERFAKDVEVAVATYKSDHNDVPIRDILVLIASLWHNEIEKMG